MTLNELSQLYWLKKEIEVDEKRLIEDGKTSAEIEEIIKPKKEQCKSERIKLERYIASIPESKIRLMFTLRFIEGQSWDEIAANVALKNKKYYTGKNCSNICYRYIRKK